MSLTHTHTWATGELGTMGDSVRRLLRSGTGPLWLLTGLIVTFGLTMTLSSSSVYSLETTGSAYTIFVRQVIWVGIGILAMLVCSQIPYQKWRKWWIPILVVALALLVMVKLPGMGISVGGAKRWVGWGPIRVQPSELAKFAFLISASALLAGRRRLLHDPVHALIPVVMPLYVAIAGLVMAEPDLGTTLVISSVCFFLLYTAGCRMRFMFGLAALGVSLVTVMAFIAPYRRARLMSFMDPFADAEGGGYQVVQSLIALGSGGPTGTGLGASRQKWMFLPNGHTDFIYAIIGEELGLTGTLLVLVLFSLLIAYCVRAARRAPDLFGTLVASGVAVWLFSQSLFNLGAVTSVLPITGVPLPFISVGGSNVMVLLLSMGIVVNIARQGDIEAQRAEHRRRKRLRDETETSGLDDDVDEDSVEPVGRRRRSVLSRRSGADRGLFGA